MHDFLKAYIVFDVYYFSQIHEMFLTDIVTYLIVNFHSENFGHPFIMKILYRFFLRMYVSFRLIINY